MDKIQNVKKQIEEIIEGADSEKMASGAINITSTGSGDGVGIGNTIIKTERVVQKIVATPKPGITEITEEQVARLHFLVDEIVRLESIGKQKPKTIQSVRNSLNRKMKVGAMRMMPLEKFPAAEKFLMTWIGRLTSQKTVQKKDADNVRKRKISYIQINMKKLDCEERVRRYMEENFGTRSLTALTCAHFSYQVELEDLVVVSKSLSSFSLNSFGVR
ncbi:MAG: hypothetical protein LBS40_00485 [Burkholderiales bacterium]|jgi:hypothetical protein|nr:hypothetical protein [Burkholderiales bacterium]